MRLFDDLSQPMLGASPQTAWRTPFKSHQAPAFAALRHPFALVGVITSQVVHLKRLVYLHNVAHQRRSEHRTCRPTLSGQLQRWQLAGCTATVDLTEGLAFWQMQQCPDSEAWVDISLKVLQAANVCLAGLASGRCGVCGDAL